MLRYLREDGLEFRYRFLELPAVQESKGALHGGGKLLCPHHLCLSRSEPIFEFVFERTQGRQACPTLVEHRLSCILLQRPNLLRQSCLQLSDLLELSTHP